jgi:sodium-dependent dicarboxylate transporter 2/3/5
MAARIGLWGGLAVFLLMLLLPAPAAMPLAAWQTTALVVLMASWWMTQALPLTATALLPFLAFPMFGIMTANETAAAYYSPILFLVLGGAIIALAIERTGLHRRLALAIVSRGGSTPATMLLAFMAATALLSLIVSNTATTLIMMPIAVAVLHAATVEPGDTDGFAGALAMGIAFAASIGGLGTLVGSPTNAIAAGIIERSTGLRIDFLTWALYGLPLVAVAIPLAWLILLKVQQVRPTDFDAAAARAGIGEACPWSTAEKRLVPLIAVVVAAWISLPFIATLLPKDSLTDGTIAIAGALLLFVLPDGTGRAILNWDEANRAPWGVIMLFGGGLALAAGIGASGLADWLGVALQPLRAVHPLVVALVLVALVVLITEFASNVAAASGVIPVVAGIIAATGIDPILLALPPPGRRAGASCCRPAPAPTPSPGRPTTSPCRACSRPGLILDIAGVPLMVAIVWMLAPLLG